MKSTIQRAIAVVFCISLLTLGPVQGWGRDLQIVETRVIEAIELESGRALELLEKSVEINSGTMNFDGVRAVGALFKAELEGLGFDTRWVDGAAFNRAGHLVGRRDGDGPRILLIGHLDTVFAIDSSFQAFKRIDAQYASGPGTTDMKGGNVIMIQALRALQTAGVLDQISVRVVMTGDEEKRGAPIDLAVAPLIEAARWADIAIGFEDGDGDPKTAVIARRSSSSWQLTVNGKAAHSSQIFRSDIGSGAIFESARILDEFRRNLSSEPYLTFNPGMIVGGTDITVETGTGRGTAFGKANVIARSTVVKGDLRVISLLQLEQAKQKMQAVVDAHLDHTEAVISFRDSYPPMAPTDGNQHLLALFDLVSKDLGHGPVAAVDPNRAGAADISFAAAHVKMAMDGVGLMGDGGHTEQETANLQSLNSQTERVAVLLYRLATQKEAIH
jgi:glutamate carboxypeptidase